MNRIRRLSRDVSSKRILRLIMLVVTAFLVLVALFSLTNPSMAILVLLSSLFAVRSLHREEPEVNLCTIRNAGRSIVFSDDKKRRFIALSAVEIPAENATRFGDGDSKACDEKILRATRILAEHVGSFGIEIDSRRQVVRYFTSATGDTVTETCQKAGTLAERILRIVRELHGEDGHIRILEGEILLNTFKMIVGGEFDTITCAGSVALCRRRGNNDVNGFSLLTAAHESIGAIDLKNLISVIRDLEADVRYVISVMAQSVYNEDSLIDGIGQSLMWLFASYFIVNESNVGTIREVTARLRNNIERLTRAGVLRTEKGSTAVREVGRILARSPIGKRRFLSNSQFITHVYPRAH